MYPAFTVFELPLLVLRLPVCVCLTIVMFGCLALLANLLSVVILSIIPLADLISSCILIFLMLLAIILCHLVKFDSRCHGNYHYLCGYGVA